MNFPLHFPLDLIMIPVQLIVVFFTLYYFFLSFFGLFKSAPKSDSKPKKSFAILVAAHNEENVIGQLVENFHILDYPDRLYDIFVVADNCTDRTGSGPAGRCDSV